MVQTVKIHLDSMIYQEHSRIAQEFVYRGNFIYRKLGSWVTLHCILGKDRAWEVETVI